MKVRNIALTAALFIGLSNMAGVAVAQTKVFIVNEAKIRSDSKLGKEMSAGLSQVAQQGADQLGLDALEKEVKAEAEALKPMTQDLSPEAIASNPTLKARVDAFYKKAGDLYQRNDRLNGELQQRGNGMEALFRHAMKPAIDAVAKEAGADVVLNYSTTWYNKDAIDLSSKVVARLDATVPTLAALQATLPPPPAKTGAAKPAAPGGGQ